MKLKTKFNQENEKKQTTIKLREIKFDIKNKWNQMTKSGIEEKNQLKKDRKQISIKK
jgi:hypothetical protein